MEERKRNWFPSSFVSSEDWTTAHFCFLFKRTETSYSLVLGWEKVFALNKQCMLYSRHTRWNSTINERFMRKRRICTAGKGICWHALVIQWTSLYRYRTIDSCSRSMLSLNTCPFSYNLLYHWRVLLVSSDDLTQFPWVCFKSISHWPDTHNQSL